MESLKQEALNVISKMPDTAEIDDIMYRLVYEFSAGEIEILAIIHGRRDFKSAWDTKDH